jgi:N-formylglutamate deformylase
MLLAERTVTAYRYRRGRTPLLVSMPHVGTFIPPSVSVPLEDVAAQRPDTDWHLPRLYDFLDELGATVIEATHSRYVVDLNRPPDDANLYPGQDTTGLVPVDTFDRMPLYRGGRLPDAGEVARRRERHWQPYHARLEAELARLRGEHGLAVLWDAHSIRSHVPRFFDGRLPGLNLGTVGGASCAPGLRQALEDCLQRHPEFTFSVDGRFRGGYITRRYGRPDEGIHAAQMEMCVALYAGERCPFPFDEARAAAVRPVLRGMLETALEWAQRAPRH